MKLIAERVRGMQDLLPEDSGKWAALCKVMEDEASLYGFKLIRTPVIEATELFERSAGSDSDVAEKEMYTFTDKGGRSVSLRPEGTAGVLRAVLENGLHNQALPVKVMYNSSCYRYEKPQSGRYREFFQFGLEIFGSDSYFADVQLISVAKSILCRLEINNISLEINSIGCRECRKKYKEKLENYLNKNAENLCDTCNKRLVKNPLRILDCKNSNCKNIAKNAPVIIDSLCKDCLEHFEFLKKGLDSLKISYKVNPGIVRGLDYYCKTVFEFIAKVDDSYITVCGGGRYNYLSKDIGGPDLCALGFGMGVERVLMVMKNLGINFPDFGGTEVYIAATDDRAREYAMGLCDILRKSSIPAESDILGRSLKAQMKYADKINSAYVLFLGDEELSTHKAKIKNMKTKEENIISIDDNFLNEFLSVQFKKFMV